MTLFQFLQIKSILKWTVVVFFSCPTFQGGMPKITTVSPENHFLVKMRKITSFSGLKC